LLERILARKKKTTPVYSGMNISIFVNPTFNSRDFAVKVKTKREREREREKERE